MPKPTSTVEVLLVGVVGVCVCAQVAQCAAVTGKGRGEGKEYDDTNTIVEMLTLACATAWE